MRLVMASLRRGDREGRAAVALGVCRHSCNGLKEMAAFGCSKTGRQLRCAANPPWAGGAHDERQHPRMPAGRGALIPQGKCRLTSARNGWNPRKDFGSTRSCRVQYPGECRVPARRAWPQKPVSTGAGRSGQPHSRRPRHRYEDKRDAKQGHRRAEQAWPQKKSGIAGCAASRSGTRTTRAMSAWRSRGRPSTPVIRAAISPSERQPRSRWQRQPSRAARAGRWSEDLCDPTQRRIAAPPWIKPRRGRGRASASCSGSRRAWEISSVRRAISAPH